MEAERGPDQQSHGSSLHAAEAGAAHTCIGLVCAARGRGEGSREADAAPAGRASASEETREELSAEVRALDARERGCGLACSAAILRSALRMAASVNSSGVDESSRSCMSAHHE